MREAAHRGRSAAFPAQLVFTEATAAPHGTDRSGPAARYANYNDGDDEPRFRTGSHPP